jgi:TrmH family RNA methyltransferase
MAAAPREPRLTEISSPSNPRVRELIALRRRRHREQSARTVVEGRAELDLALRAGVRPTALYHCPDLAGDGPASANGGHGAADADAARLLARVAGTGAALFRLSRTAFEKAAYRESPDGWLAVVPEIETRLARIETGERPLVLVCEGVEKPGNLGSMLRTADAAGVSAVISADPVTDWGNPNVIRASKGTVFAVPVASCDSAEARRWLAERGVRTVALTPDTDTVVTDLDLTGPTAILVGSEKYGLSDDWLAGADSTARIPMSGQVDSLNVAVSAAIVTYEAVRQRR